MSRMSPLKVVTVTAPFFLRNTAGSFLSRSGDNGPDRLAPVAVRISSISEDCTCSSMGITAVTNFFSTPEPISMLACWSRPSPAPRIWWPLSVCGGASLMSVSAMTWVWQARRKPSWTSSGPSCTSSMMVGGGTFPLRTLNRQPRHLPRAPQVAVTSMSAPRAASRNEVPDSVLTGVRSPSAVTNVIVSAVSMFPLGPGFPFFVHQGPGQFDGGDGVYAPAIGTDFIGPCLGSSAPRR